MLSNLFANTGGKQSPLPEEMDDWEGLWEGVRELRAISAT